MALSIFAIKYYVLASKLQSVLTQVEDKWLLCKAQALFLTQIVLITASCSMFLIEFYKYTSVEARNRPTQNFVSLEIAVCFPGFFLTIWLLSALLKVRKVESAAHGINKS